MTRTLTLLEERSNDRLTILVESTRRKYWIFGPEVRRAYKVRGRCTVWCYMNGSMVGGFLEGQLTAAWTRYRWAKEDGETSHHIPLPQSIPKCFNACNEPCDMLIGPCACGGTHDLEYWTDLDPHYGELARFEVRKAAVRGK